MIKVFLEFLEFLRTLAPLLTSLLIFTLSAVLLAKSIKKHAKVYYIAFSIPFILVAIPTILRWCGIEMVSFTRVPVLGEILRDYIHMGSMGHPLLVIIMYMGALDTRKTYVKRLMSIRKELSIISGFPILTHSLIRVSNNFPKSLKYFTAHAEYMADPKITSELGSGISSFSMVLGIIMLAFFLPLWITSFDSVHKHMGAIKWKKLQKWSYGLYAMLFIHAMGIQVGGMISRNAAGKNEVPKTQVVADARPSRQGGERTATPDMTQQGQRGKRTENPAEAGVANRTEKHGEKVAATAGNQQQPQPAAGGRPKTKGFSDFEVGANAKRIVAIASLLLIYGSYLFLRVRKARRSAAKKRV